MPSCTQETERCLKTHDNTPINACCKDHLLELLNYITRTLEINNIKYWLDYGTLLGAVREGQQIAWDDDCDISILMEDEQKVADLLEKNPFGYIVINTSITEKPSFAVLRYSVTNSLHVDIFPWKQDDNLMKRRNYLDAGPISPDAKKGKHFPYSFIENLIKINFEGNDYFVPSNPIDFCKMRYGKAWDIPYTVAEWNTLVDNDTNKIYNYND